MSLLCLDSLSRYASTDGAGLTGITRTGNGLGGSVGVGYSGYGYHRTTGGMFGQPFISLSSFQTGEYSEIPNGAYINYYSGTSLGDKIGLHCKMSMLHSTGAGGGADAGTAVFPIMFRNISGSQIVKIGCEIWNSTISSESNTYIADYGWINTPDTAGVFSYGGSGSPVSNPYYLASGATGLTAGYPALTTFSSIRWTSVDLLMDRVTGLMSYKFSTSAGSISGSWPVFGANAMTSIASIILGNYDGYFTSRTRNTTCLFSDVVIYSNDASGLTGFLPTPNLYRVKRLVPDGVGTNNAWTASTGTSATCVDDTPVSDTDYTQSTATSTKVDFTLPNLGSGSTDIKSNILGLQVNSHFFDTGATVATALPIQTISGVETSLGSALTIDRSNYTVKTVVRETNPETSVAYTAANIDNLAVGFNVG